MRRVITLLLRPSNYCAWHAGLPRNMCGIWSTVMPLIITQTMLFLREYYPSPVLMGQPSTAQGDSPFKQCYSYECAIQATALKGLNIFHYMTEESTKMQTAEKLASVPPNKSFSFVDCSSDNEK